MFKRLFLVLCVCQAPALFATELPESVKAARASLGKLIFRDQSLSVPLGKSCHDCHQSEGFDADPGAVLSSGSSAGSFSARNSPSITYIAFNPVLYRDQEEDHWVGGFFLDGRARDLHQQVTMPFLDPVEMGNTEPVALAAKFRRSLYSLMFSTLYGDEVWASTESTLAAAADALVFYLRSDEFAPFDSKYDAYLAGKAELTAEEKLGLELFEAEDKGNCAACHPSQANAATPPLFTDYTYDNLGLPRAESAIDKGLAENPHIHDPQQQLGKFKVPSLRNVAATAPYMHNGMLATLEDVVEFYNKRDVLARWQPPEIEANVNREELGDLGLSAEEEAALVAFMKTLTDGYQPDSE